MATRGTFPPENLAREARRQSHRSSTSAWVVAAVTQEEKDAAEGRRQGRRVKITIEKALASTDICLAPPPGERDRRCPDGKRHRGRQAPQRAGAADQEPRRPRRRRAPTATSPRRSRSRSLPPAPEVKETPAVEARQSKPSIVRGDCFSWPLVFVAEETRRWRSAERRWVARGMVADWRYRPQPSCHEIGCRARGAFPPCRWPIPSGRRIQRRRRSGDRPRGDARRGATRFERTSRPVTPNSASLWGGSELRELTSWPRDATTPYRRADQKSRTWRSASATSSTGRSPQ